MFVGNFVYIFVVVFALVASTGATEGYAEEVLNLSRIAFPQIDTDGDGKIRCDQLMELLLAAVPTITEDNVDMMKDMMIEDMIVAIADVDDDNMLTIDELINFFTALQRKEPQFLAQLRAEMFKVHDTDKNGKMSLEELKAIFLVFGFPEHWLTGMLEGALQLWDADEDGEVSLEEFVNAQNGGADEDRQLSLEEFVNAQNGGISLGGF